MQSETTQSKTRRNIGKVRGEAYETDEEKKKIQKRKGRGEEEHGGGMEVVAWGNTHQNSFTSNRHAE